MGSYGNFREPASFPCLPEELTPYPAGPYLTGDPKPPCTCGQHQLQGSLYSWLLGNCCCRLDGGPPSSSGFPVLPEPPLSQYRFCVAHILVFGWGLVTHSLGAPEALCQAQGAPSPSDPKPFLHPSSIACMWHRPSPATCLQTLSSRALLSPHPQPLLLDTPEPVPPFPPFVPAWPRSLAPSPGPQ